MSKYGMVDVIISSNDNVDLFNLLLSNILNRLWSCTSGEYQDLANYRPDIDFENYRQIENTCKLFAIIRYIAMVRKFNIKFNEIYFDKRLHLKIPYYGEYANGKDCVRLLTRSPQPFYDYNCFYYTYSLEIK